MSSYGGNSYSGRGVMGSGAGGGAGGPPQRGRGGGGLGGPGYGPVHAGRSGGSGRKLPPALCSSCNSPLSPDELLMSSQTEGRCVTCQQLLEAQSACRVCHLPWDPQHDAMITCDSCGFYMHDHCAKKGALQTKSGGRVYTYCPHCPPTLPPPSAAPMPPLPGASAGGRGSGGGLPSRGPGSGGEPRAGRPNISSAGPQPLGVPSAAAQQQQLQQHPMQIGHRSPGGSGRGSGRGGGAATVMTLQPPPPLPHHQLQLQPQQQLQQVAAMLQGQFRMVQTQQQELLRQYDQQLRAVAPLPPPTAYSLFQLDMYRVYQEEGFEIDPQELQPIINNAWLQLTPDERAGYDHRANQEMASWTANAQLFVQLYYEYETLASHVGAVPDTGLLPKSLQGMLQSVRQMSRLGGGGGAGGAAAAALPPPSRGPGRPTGSGAGGGGSRGVKRSAMDTLAGATALIGMTGGGARGGGGMAGAVEADDDDDDEDYEAEGAAAPQGGGGAKRPRRAISPSVPSAPAPVRPPPRNTRLPAEKLPTGIADLPPQLSVSCNDVTGTFIMDGIKVLCHCGECAVLPRGQREFHPTHWEQHCGAGTAKKWKASVKIEPGGAPEVPPGGNPMQIGKWFDMLGVEFRPAKTTGGPPVLEFTGATIRRMEADGAVASAAVAATSAAGGGGSAGGSQSQVQQQMQQQQQSQPPSPQPSLQAAPSPQQKPQPQPPPQLQQQQMQQMPLQQMPLAAAPLPPPRPARAPQALPPLRGATPAGGAVSGGGSRRGGDDGHLGAYSAPSGGGGGGTAKPPRPVSDGDGDGDGFGDGTVYSPDGRSTAVASQPPRCGGGEEGESSSRGSASDTLGPNTTA